MAALLTVSCFLLWMSHNYTVPVMMYHSVDYADKPEANWVSPELFERHMAYLFYHKYHVISLDELVDSIKEGRKISKKSVVITFDDGYENNYTYALNILKKYGFPATIFIPSDFLDTHGHLTTQQVKEMAQQKIDVGSHSRTHAYLPGQPEITQKDEIRGSRQALEEKVATEIKYFAYPIGGFSPEIKKIVREAGYKGACTTNRGNDRANKDVYALKRIRFSNNDDKDHTLWIKLSGYYNLFRRLKDPY